MQHNDALATTHTDSPAAQSNAMDTTRYRSLVQNYNSIRYNYKNTYNQDVCRLKYDPFKEKMKESWIDDIKKNLFPVATLCLCYPTNLGFHKNRTETTSTSQTIKKVRRLFFGLCGVYGTRTRDPMRDRHVF